MHRRFQQLERVALALRVERLLVWLLFCLNVVFIWIVPSRQCRKPNTVVVQLFLNHPNIHQWSRLARFLD
jgi:hypothetical protein